MAARATNVHHAHARAAALSQLIYQKHPNNTCHFNLKIYLTYTIDIP